MSAAMTATASTGLQTIRALIDARAAEQPDAPYFIAPHTGRSLRFGELAQSSRAIAAWLAARGLPPGAHLSLVLGNGIQTVRLLLGALYGGYCVNPVNLVSQSEQMRYVLDHADARLVVASPEWMQQAREMTAGLSRPVELVALDPDGDELPWTSEKAVPPPPAADALALLMYTSGTTGKPKGVMLTQANLTANAQAISREHQLGPGDRVTAVLPLYHINAFAVTMLSPLAHGGSLVMPPRFSARSFWDMVIEQHCTWLNVVPTMISYLLDAAQSGGSPPRERLRGVRFCRSASAALAPELHRQFEATFGIGIVETMGLTETVAPAFSNPIEQPHRKIGSVGRASGCEARVVDAQGQPVADGSIGEIAIRGPQVTAGYYKNPEASANAFFPGGWLRTGDLGYRDGDGFFFVTGRIKELIIKGGENIAPREIDEALLRHPAVLDAAAVGIPDRHYGQEIMACVILRDGQALSEDELRSFCDRELGRYKTPKVFRFVADLPRGPSGKVQRLKLVELAELAESAASAASARSA
jgi:acyl-CoA synthetase (AMP-forming)/AMP-acid ligase II